MGSADLLAPFHIDRPADDQDPPPPPPPPSSPLEALSADYLHLFKAGQAFSDVTFLVEGRHIHAHKCVLAARSNFFRIMFSCNPHSSSGSCNNQHYHDHIMDTPHATGLFNHEHHHQLEAATEIPPFRDTSTYINNSMAAPSAISTSLHMSTPQLQIVSNNSHQYISPNYVINSSIAIGSSNSAIPVEIVGYDVFIAILQFLYSGQLIMEPMVSQSNSSLRCQQRPCTHSHCPLAVHLCLEMIQAAKFFGVDQLSELVQRRLTSIIENVSVESLMRVLLVAKKQKFHHLWQVCSDLVMNSGLGLQVLRKYLPPEVLHELAETRSLQRSYAAGSQTSSLNISNNVPSHSTNPNLATCSDEHRNIFRLQQALDCMDVELVRLMVMGEGLNLDKAHALHYSVTNCSREVVKALLELGVVDVNYADGIGRTALHLAAEMGNADMIAVLLDHHADPNAQTEEGFGALDIVRGLIKGSANHDHSTNPQANYGPAGISDHQSSAATEAAPQAVLCKADQKRIHLCIELLQSAAAVVGREEADQSSSCITTQGHVSANRVQIRANHAVNPALSCNLSPNAVSADQGSFSPDQQMNYGYLFSAAYPEAQYVPGHQWPAKLLTDQNIAGKDQRQSTSSST